MDWTFTPATRSERRSALELVLRQVADSDSQLTAEIDEMLESSEQNGISLEGLFIGRKGSEMIGAGLVILQSDGTAHVWPPAVVDSKRGDPAMVQDALRRLGDHTVFFLRRSNA
ncbi:MAG: hypothetical protein JWM11_2721, partial [Planctomycetaceae bacterium]|nr:hypothetical protein [Planctomycetaceae bacterium]